MPDGNLPTRDGGHQDLFHKSAVDVLQNIHGIVHGTLKNGHNDDPCNQIIHRILHGDSRGFHDERKDKQKNTRDEKVHKQSHSVSQQFEQISF